MIESGVGWPSVGLVICGHIVLEPFFAVQDRPITIKLFAVGFALLFRFDRCLLALPSDGLVFF